MNTCNHGLSTHCAMCMNDAASLRRQLAIANAEIDMLQSSVAEIARQRDEMEAILSASVAVTAQELERLRKDSQRLDFLEGQYVKVCQPLQFGSRTLFLCGPDEEDNPSSLRAQTDAAIQASQSKGE